MQVIADSLFPDNGHVTVHFADGAYGLSVFMMRASPLGDMPQVAAHAAGEVQSKITRVTTSSPACRSLSELLIGVLAIYRRLFPDRRAAPQSIESAIVQFPAPLPPITCSVEGLKAHHVLGK